MKEKLLAHWGMMLFFVAIFFAAFVSQQALSLKGRVNQAKEDIKKSKATVKINIPVAKSEINLTGFQEQKDYYDAARPAAYNMEREPTAKKETWNTKDTPTKVLVNGKIFFTRPKTTLHLKDFNDSDIQVKVGDSGFGNGKIKVEKVPGIGNQLRISGEKATFNEPLQVTVRNQRLGDFAKFYVAVEQQIKLYYYVPKSSISTEYDAEASLDTIRLSWKKSQVSITDAATLKVDSYKLMRKIWMTEKGAKGEAAAAFVPIIRPGKDGQPEPMVWKPTDNITRYIDTDIKALHSYRYKVVVNVWHTPNPLPPDFTPTDAFGFPEASKTKEWLIGKTKIVDYDASKTVNIGKDKLLMGFSRKLGGVSTPEAEVLIKKWDDGQWISGLVRLKETEKVVPFGQAPNLFPISLKKKSLAKQIANKDLVELKGVALRITVGGKPFKNVPFEVDDYLLYMMKDHDVDDMLNAKLLELGYFDPTSLKEVYDKTTKKIFKKCTSFWVINRKDSVFLEGRPFPKDLIIYFGSNDASRRLRGLMKEINKGAAGDKVDGDAVDGKPGAAGTTTKKPKPKTAYQLKIEKKKREKEEARLKKEREKYERENGGPDGPGSP